MKFPLSPPAFKFAFAALLLARVGTVSAGEAPDIFGEGSSEIGTFNEIVSFFNTWGEFISGPVAMVIVFIAMVGLLFVWVIAPRAGEAVGMGIRVFVAGIALLNIVSWLTYLTNL